MAPPVQTSPFDVLRRSTAPKDVIQGVADDVCPLPKLLAEFSYWAEPKRLVTVEGASHFFDRKLDALGEVVRELFGSGGPGAAGR